MDIKTIRKAIDKHHGGNASRDDDQIKIIWDSLPEETQEKYLNSLKGEKKDAIVPKSERKP